MLDPCGRSWERLLIRAAMLLGLRVELHAEQFSLAHVVKGQRAGGISALGNHGDGPTPWSGTDYLSWMHRELLLPVEKFWTSIRLDQTAPQQLSRLQQGRDVVLELREISGADFLSVDAPIAAYEERRR